MQLLMSRQSGFVRSAREEARANFESFELLTLIHYAVEIDDDAQKSNGCQSLWFRRY